MKQAFIAIFLLLQLFGYAQSNRQIVLKPQGHTALITDIVAAPDGKHVLTCSFDKTIKYWDVETGILEDEFLGESGTDNKGAYQKIAVSPYGKFVAAGCILNTAGSVGLKDDYGIRLFKISTRKLQSVFPVQGGNFKKILFTGKENELAAATEQEIFLYNYSTNQLKDSISIDDDVAISQMVCLDGQIFISKKDGNILKWDRSLKKLISQKIFGENIYSFTVSDKTHRFALSTQSGKLILLSQNFDVLDQTINTNIPIGLAFSPDGNKLIAGKLTQDGACILYSTAGDKFKKITEYNKQVGILGAVAMLNNETVVTAGGNNHSVAVWSYNSATSFPNELFVLKSKSIQIMAASVYASMLAFSTEEMYSANNFPHRLRFDLNDHQFEQVIPMGTLPYMLPKPVLKLEKNELVINEDPQQGLMVNITQDGKVLNQVPFTNALACTYLPNGLIAVGGKAGALRIYDFYGAEVANLNGHTDYVTSLTITEDSRFLVSSSIDGTIRFWNIGELNYNDTELPSAESQVTDTVLINTINKLGLTQTAKLKTSAAWYKIISTLFENGKNEAAQRIFNTYYTLKQFFLNNITPEANVFLTTDEDWIIWNKNGYYTSSKNGSKLIGFQENRGQNKEAKFFPFQQFDLQYNRPDIIYNLFNPYDTVTTTAFYNAWQRRIRLADIDTSSFNTILNLPDISVANTSHVSTQPNETLTYSANDSLFFLDKINLAVNGSPVYGMKGKNFESKKHHSISNGILPDLISPINLNTGKNIIQLSVTNEKGIESLKEIYTVNYNSPTVKKPNLYIITIGVSTYLNSTYNLQYAAKDAIDMAAALASKKGNYDSIYVFKLTNSDATLENIQLLKKKLMQTNVDDEVIVFFAGHGMLSKDYTYYFATHDIDFADPAKKGISFEQIEDLLDGIPARKKLLMMDTCHSGEPDKEGNGIDIAALSSPAKTNPDVQFVKARGITLTKARGVINNDDKSDMDEKKVGLKKSFLLLEQLFSDLRQSSGTIVIAASSGDGYSLESEKWHNGVFTYSVLYGLQSGKADLDKDGSITVSELRNFVIDEVSSLTQGKQKPTIRRDNIEMDFKIW